MADNNVKGVGDRGWLNQCLFCDEKLSGPEFVKVCFVAYAIISFSVNTDYFNIAFNSFLFHSVLA
jgi:hypothetical protein